MDSGHLKVADNSIISRIAHRSGREKTRHPALLNVLFWVAEVADLMYHARDHFVCCWPHFLMIAG